MSEEIKIKISTEYDDAGAKKALQDEQKLQQAGAKSGAGTGSGAATPAGRTAESKQADARLAAETQITREREKQAAVGKAQNAYHQASGGRLRGDSSDPGTGHRAEQDRLHSRLKIARGREDGSSAEARTTAQQARDEWWRKVGQRELEMSKAQARGDRAQVGELPDALTGIGDAQRLTNAAASEQRQRAGRLAGLVTARDGAADTAAVAREAMAMRGGAGGAEAIANRLIPVLRQHHAEAMNTVHRVDHTKR